MNYEEMSDFEINKAVAIALGINVPSEKSPWLWEKNSCLHQLNGDGSKIEKTIVTNYCNNPEDAWLVIVKNKISIVTVGAEWEAHWFSNLTLDEEFNTTNKNPLRAAMICFLKMKDAENE